MTTLIYDFCAISKTCFNSSWWYQMIKGLILNHGWTVKCLLLGLKGSGLLPEQTSATPSQGPFFTNN